MCAESRRTALVTGASAGLGETFARAYAARGHDLVVTARRADRLQVLSDELTREHDVSVLVVPADLADPGACAHIVDAVQAAGVTVDVLVNNAGYGVPGYFKDHAWQEHAAFVQVMVTSVLHLTHLLLPGMLSRGHGRIINVASLAALIPGSAGHTLYGASKAFMVKTTESLSLELRGTGVQVTATCPGFTYTEFHDVLGNRARVSELPGFMWMDAEEVVRDALDAVERGRTVTVPGGVNRAIATLSRLVPRSLALASMARGSSRIRSQK